MASLMMPPNLSAVLFSFFIKGVPVKAIKQPLGKTCCIFTFSGPYWLRCPSSIKMKMSGDSNGCFIWRKAVSNLWMSVVTTASLFFSINSTKCVPVWACSTGFSHFLKVSKIWSSKSMRSVTSKILAWGIFWAIICASITIVSDLPLPCVCQITPPRRLPMALMISMRFNTRRMAKNC